MAGASISEVRAAIAEQLRANIDAETNVAEFGIAKPLPCISITLSDAPTYNSSYSGVAVIPFIVSIQPAGDDESAVRRLDAYLSAGLGNLSSVIDALRVKDGPLSSVAQLVEILPRSYDAELLTAELDVLVHVAKIRV